MSIIMRLFLSLFLVKIFIVSAYCENYKVAIFDYDLRSKTELTVAKHIEKRLKKSGLKFSKIDQFTGEENEKKALKVLKKLEASNYDLIITITSDAMIPGLHKVKKTPWLFTNVNNPKFFGISNLKKPGRNVSGVTYYIPVTRQIKFFKEILGGKLKKLGLIFDYHAKSRKAELREFRAAAKKLGIAYEIELIKNKSDLSDATNKLLKSKVDAIVLTSSGRVYKNADLVVGITSVKKIPVFSVNKKGVIKGAISALASDYYVMVDECLIPMAKEVLKNGKSPGAMPVRNIKKPMVYLNTTQAKKIDLVIPRKVKKRALKTY
ncbi:MAG: hypothetical protein GY714_20615 [Desulfobacterales bacterium]|nr:hypothetical protein [Desulfobacterales bacterium]